MNYKPVEQLVLNTKSIIDDKTSFSVDLKAKNDFVTNIDIAVSNYLKKELAEIYPEVSFFSEEESGHLHDNCWILDPIDGTANLVYGYNMSSVSLAHCKNGEIQFGIVFNPFNGEVFTAERGKGAYLNHTKRLFASRREIGDSLIEFGSGSTHKELTEETFRLVMEIFKDCVDVRRICSSALVLCYIAAGRLDGYFEKILKPWDYAAGGLILEEAGGALVDYSGQPLQYAGTSSVIAGNPIVKDYLLQKIQKFYGDVKR